MKEYTVVIGGVEHTLLMDPEDAKARGYTEAKAPAAPEAKAATPANKSRASSVKTKE